MVNTLIIACDLVHPPTDTLSFRSVTMYGKEQLGLSILLEVASQEKDAYLYFMRPRGLMDYVREFVTPEEKERGIRLSPENNLPITLIAQNIRFENQLFIIGKLKYLFAREGI